MKTTNIFLLAVLMFASQPGTADSVSTLEQIKQTGTVRIGYRESEPPMSFIDKDKNPAGYSIDLCIRIVNEVKQTLGNQEISIKYIPVTAANRFQALTDNKIDILCGSTTKTISRAEMVDFTQHTFVTGASLLSMRNDAIEGISGLQGKKVAVVKDTTTIDHLATALKDAVIDAKVVPVNSASEGMKALISGEVHAFASDQVVLIGLALTNEGDEEFSIAEDVFSFEPVAMAVKRNDSEFRFLADRALSRLYRSGQITPIYKKWFGRFTKEVPSMLQAMYLLNSTPE